MEEDRFDEQIINNSFRVLENVKNSNPYDIWGKIILHKIPNLLVINKRTEELLRLLCDLRYLQSMINRGISKEIIERIYETTDLEFVSFKLWPAIRVDLTQVNDQLRDFTFQQIYNTLISRHGYEIIEKNIRVFNEPGDNQQIGISGKKRLWWFKRLNQGISTSVSLALARTIGISVNSVKSLSISTDRKFLTCGLQNGGTFIINYQRYIKKSNDPFQKTTEPPNNSGIHHEDQNISEGLFSSEPNSVSTLKWLSVNELAIGCSEGKISLYRNSDRTRLAEKDAHKGLLTSLLVNQGTATIVSAGQDRLIKCWEWNLDQEKNERQLFRGHLDGVSCLAWYDRNSKIVSGSQDHTVRLWSIDGTWDKTFRGHFGAVTTVVSWDNDFIASGSEDGTIRIWKLSTDRAIHVLKEHNSAIRAIVVGRVKLNAVEGENILVLVSCSDDGTIRLWLINSEGEIKKKDTILRGHIGSVNTLLLDSQGHTLVSGGEDGTIRFWDLYIALREVPAETQSWQEHSDRVNAISVDRERKFIVTASDDTTIRLWNSDSGKYIATFRGHLEGVTCISFLTSGNIVSGGRDGLVKVWNRNFPKEVYTMGFPFGGHRLIHIAKSSPTPIPLKIGGHEGPITDVLGIEDNLLLSVSTDRTIRLWDCNVGKKIHTFRDENPLSLMAYCKKSKLLFGAGALESITVWDLSTTNIVKRIKGHEHNITCIKLISDKLLVSGSRDGTFCFWEIPSFKIIHRDQLSRKPVVCIDANEVKREVAVAYEDGMICVLSEPSSKIEQLSLQTNSPLYGVLFDQSGYRLFSWTEDSYIYMWVLEENRKSDWRIGARIKLHSPVICATFLHPDRICVGLHNGGTALFRIQEF